jgi:large subunit ribosomal protein L29
MKFNELTSLGDEAIVHKELQMERDLLELRFRLKTNQLDDTATISKLRKDIARLRTAQRERERAQGLPKNALRNNHRSTFRAGGGVAAEAVASSSGFLKGITEKFGGDQE